MEYVSSFSTTKAGKAYVVNVKNLHPDGDMMVFHVDSGASVTFLGLDSFCSPEKSEWYILLKNIIQEEIKQGGFEAQKKFASTATNEAVEMYPCRYAGVAVSDTKPIS